MVKDKMVVNKREKLIGAMGMPRGGTHFISSLLKRFGFKVGTHFMSIDGISDWRLIWFLEDLIDIDGNYEFDTAQNNYGKFYSVDVKYGKVCHFCGKKKYIKDLHRVSYKHVLHFIRNPFHTISTSSQVYTYPFGNDAIHSLLFFSNNEKKVGEFKNAIEQSTVLYLEYHKRMEKKSDITIVLENAEEELNDYFLKNNLIEERLSSEQLRVSKEYKTSGITAYNKKRLTVKQIEEAISTELFEELAEYAKKYGYKTD